MSPSEMRGERLERLFGMLRLYCKDGAAEDLPPDYLRERVDGASSESPWVRHDLMCSAARVLLDQAAATEGNQGRRQGFAHDAAWRREALLLNSSEILANVLGERLADIYTRAFSSCEPRYAEIIGEAAKLVLERIGMSDALYHSAEHTALVTLVGQDILRGERLRRRLSAEDWMHFTVATLAHDLGYVRGICRDDRPGAYVIDRSGQSGLRAPVELVGSSPDMRYEPSTA